MSRLEQQSGAGERSGVQPLNAPGAKVHAIGGDRPASHTPGRTQAVIIAGAHRSGTSALTRALSLCGLGLPKSTIPGDEFNQDGYWESGPIGVLNDEMLRAMDSAWDDVFSSRVLRDVRFAPAQLDRIKEVVRDQYEPGNGILIKDPRISLLLPVWRAALEDAGFQVTVLVLNRHPLEVAASLHRRDGFPIIKGALLWLSHLIAVERDSRGCRRAFINYEDLLSDWRACFRRASHKAGMVLPRWTPTSELAIDEFLSPQRRHHAADPRALEGRTDLPSWLATAYRWSLAAARDDEEPSPNALEEIANQFHQEANLYAPLLAYEKRRAREAAQTPKPKPENRVDFSLTLYSATEQQGFDEAASVTETVHVSPIEQRVVLTTPPRGDRIAFLRLDPSQAEGAYLLHALVVRNPDGSVLWLWAGEMDIFQIDTGVAAQAINARTALLEFVNDDPQILLPLPSSTTAPQLTVELTISRADPIDIELLRLRTATEANAASLAAGTHRLETAHAETKRQIAAAAGEARDAQIANLIASQRLEDRISAQEGRLEDLSVQISGQASEHLAALSDSLSQLQANINASLSQIAGFIEHRLGAQSDDAAARERANAATYERKLENLQGRLDQVQHHVLRDNELVEQILRDRELLSELSGELVQTRNARDEAYSVVGALRSSTSWRLTAPVRALKSGPRAVAAELKNIGRAVWRRLRGKTYATDPRRLAATNGSARLLERSSLFDPEWYLMTYPDLKSASADPLEHYLQHGGFEGRMPGPAFDSRWYLAQNPDVAQAGVNPLVHYLAAGKKEGRTPLPPIAHAPRRLSEHMPLLRRARHWKYLIARSGLAIEGALPRSIARRLRRTESANVPRPPETGGASGPQAHAAAFDDLFAAAQGKGAEYVPLSHEHAAASRIRAIAFYLPQFHPIPENDAWWGKGFTEWTNVSKATPQFLGHYQPRLPDELGFYDLRVPEIQRRQVELARQYGVHGFCFHYYWFTGRRRLLERPLNQFLDSDIDFPFCVCWANENWTRRWDGLDQEILMEQRHEPQDDLQFIQDLAPVLSDPRYIKIDGRPLIIVYRVDILPRPQETARVWRQFCRDQGLGEPYLVAAQSFGMEDPRPYGFDAAVEFPPHGDYSPEEITREQHFLNSRSEGRVYSYEAVAKREMSAPWPDYTLFRTVMPSWDNEARKPGRGHAFLGATPALYRAWLTAVGRATDGRYDNPQQKLVFINAWNEWAEGAYLEPDRRYGYAFLQATKEALASFPASGALTQRSAGEAPLYVVVHAFYPDLFAEILDYLRRLKRPLMLYTTCPPEKAKAVRDVFKRAKLDCPFELVEVENRGRDVYAFMEALRRHPVPAHAVIVKVHSKKSVHRSDGANWRRELLDQLLSPHVVEQALGAFAVDERLGLIAPAGHLAPITSYIGFNQARIEDLLRRGGWRNVDLSKDVFAAGTMFIARRSALQPVLALGLSRDDFEIEAGQKDGTLAHALERMFALAILREGGVVIDTHALLHGENAPPADGYGYAVSTESVYRAPDS